MQFKLIFCIFTILIFIGQAEAQEVIQCPATSQSIETVDFTASTCSTSSFSDFVMSPKPVWVRVNVNIHHGLLNSGQPIGFFLSGWMNASVYINNTHIGNKGKPSFQPENEIPGPFDWSAYVPKEILHQALINVSNKEQQSQQVVVDMLLSSFHNDREIFHPFNRIYIDEYQSATSAQLANYWPTLVPLGIMLVGLLFLISQKIIQKFSPQVSSPINNTYILLMTIVAMCQLLVEISRGLYAYNYTVHDDRLLGVWILALIFGHLLLLQVIQSVKQVKRLAVVLISLIVVFIIHEFYIGPDPDLRASSSIQIPSFIAACIVFYASWNKNIRDKLPAWALLVFCLVIQLSPHEFLDIYLYYSMAILLTFMLSYQAFHQNKLQRKLHSEKERADKLQLALDLKVSETSVKTISLKDAGKIIICKVDDLLYCKGAGDYVEVVTKDATILHSGSLHRLADEFPASFIKVHRSYIVNAKHITSIKRLSSGTGEVTINHEYKIPVSRRLLPTIKSTLTES